MSNSEMVLFERQGAVARLTLNRPEAANAIDLPLARALMEAANACGEDDSIRCVVLTGAGRLFCAGGDIAGFAAAGEKIPSLLKELTAYIHMAIIRFLRMPKPLITAVNGPAAGAGLSLAVMGDIVLASPAAHFTLAYSAIGFTPDGGASWMLPRLIGLRRTQELMLTNRRVGAEEAAAIGLVTRLTEADALADEAQALAVQLASSASRALGKTRNLILESFDTSLETHLEAEACAIAEASRSDEGREGVAAFIAKRKPNFGV